MRLLIWALFITTAAKAASLMTPSAELKAWQKGEAITVILGNQSADLDSIFGAWGLAHFYRNVLEHRVVPVTNIPRANMRLRRGCLEVLKRAKRSTSDLVFIDDPLLITVFDSPKSRVVLYDHNKLAPHQSYLEPKVAAILDHHYDQKVRFPQLSTKSIQSAASGATLVAHLLRKNKLLTPDLAQILLAPILIDSKNLTDEIKTTASDETEVKTLCSLVPFSCRKYFLAIRRAKRNISGFTPRDLIVRDYKVYSELPYIYGFSSLPKAVVPKRFAKFAPHAIKFAQEAKLDFLLLLFKPSGKTSRTLFVYTPHPQEKVSAHFAGLTNFIREDTELKNFLRYRVPGHSGRKILQPQLKLATLCF